jgi:hypothetical protein
MHKYLPNPCQGSFLRSVSAHCQEREGAEEVEGHEGAILFIWRSEGMRKLWSLGRLYRERFNEESNLAKMVRDRFGILNITNKLGEEACALWIPRFVKKTPDGLPAKRQAHQEKEG